jgi:hypothetical protein
MSLWPDIEKLCREDNEDNLQHSKNVKIPGNQLFYFYHRLQELEQVISEAHQQIQDLTEINLRLQDGGDLHPSTSGDPSSPNDQGVQIMKLKTRLSQKDLEIVRLMGEKNEKLKEISTLKKDLKTMSKNILEGSPYPPDNEAGATSITSMAENQRYQKEIKNYQTKLQSLTQKSTIQEKEMDMILKEKMGLIDQLKEKIMLLERSAPPGKSKLPTVSSEAELMKQEMVQLQEENEMLQAEIASTFQEKDELTLQLENAQKNEKLLEKNLQKINSQLIKMKPKAITKASKDVIDKKIYLDLKKENTQLEKSFQIMRENFQSMSHKYQTVKNDLEIIKKQPDYSPEPSEHLVKPSERFTSDPQADKIDTGKVDQDKTILLQKTKKPSVPVQHTSHMSTSSGQTFGTRIVCPSCGSSGNKIKIQEDKSQIISYIPRVIYKKRYFCSQCGYRFD